MKGKLLTIFSLILIVAGTVAGYFAVNDVAQLSAFAVTMFGAGLAVANMWKNRKEGAKTWLVVLALVFLGLGSFLAGLTGALSEKTVTTVIGYTISLVAIIAGIVTTAVANAVAKKE